MVVRLWRVFLITIEIAVLTGLILATRCANYRDVFVAGNVYFTDADCYARMTRVRMCAEHPGLVVRHHDFENYPAGTSPHTTAPLDYLILALATALRPFTAHALDLAGALISPLLALVCGCFLWWWARAMKFRYRWPMLILYAISPILVHGTELGRPDHQSLLMLLLSVAICAEWILGTRTGETPATLHRWSIVSAIAWGLAIWVSVYEPFLLLLVVIAMAAWRNPQSVRHRRTGWICFISILALALLIERRAPFTSVPVSSALFRAWAHTIGELHPVWPFDPVWFRWAGYWIALAPILIFFAMKQGRMEQRRLPAVLVVLLVATYALTIWQARWSYFFLSTFIIALPALLEPVRSRVIVWIMFIVSIFAVLREWDGRLWPNELEYARQMAARNESVQLRELASSLKSPETHPFLAPWWLSPAVAYWSGQPGAAGSSHESLAGIADSARFFAATDPRESLEILKNHRIDWILGYDADRTAENCAAILGRPISEHALCFVLYRAPTKAPGFLSFSAQNATAKLFRLGPVANNR